MKDTDQNGHSETKKFALTSWLKLKFTKDNDTSLVDTKFIADFSDSKTVGRYDVEEKAGQGSMGIVYLGRDPFIKRPVAIKVSRPHSDLPTDEIEKYQKRFFTEAQSAGRLNHPHIVSIYDAGMHLNFYYITMEYIDGPTLKKFCNKESLLPVNRVMEIIFSACKAIDYAHSKGVYHRDIKPSNMMLNSTGKLKITDFGIAYVDTEYTAQKGIIGSPCYMSPEQVKEVPVIDQSDIFSLGCVLYELLTGQKAFAGDNHFAVMYKITHEDPPSLQSIRKDLPKVLDKITMRALAKDPKKRYQTCMDLAYDLRVALRGITGTVKKSKVEDVVDYVRNVSFFESFSKEQVKQILKPSNLIKVSKGKVLVSEGEIDDSFFIILSGHAVVRKNKKNIAVINRGECFGEMAYLGDQTRAATVVAGSDCVLMKISATLLGKSSETIQLLFLKRFAMTLLARLSGKK
ncbi:serine/threonine-protein kinase [Thermodesulfobacteriota bacterium]